MLFKVVDKVNWKDDVWDKLFNLVNDFRNEYSLKIKDMGYLGNLKNQYYISVGEYNIYFASNSQDHWITLEANVSKDDFDDKFDFIFSKIV